MAKSPLITLIKTDSKVAEQLRASEIRSVAASIESGNQKVFAKSIEFGRLMVNAKAWFDGNQSICKANDITWKSILTDLFGFTEKQLETKWYKKLLKAGSVSEEQLLEFTKWAQENKQSVSILGLIRWLSPSEEEATAEGGEEAQKSQCVVSFTFKLPLIQQGERNVSVSVDTSMNVKTSNSQDELKKAIELLTKALNLIEG